MPEPHSLPAPPRCLLLPLIYCCLPTLPLPLQGLGKALVEGMTRTLLRRDITNITLFADAQGKHRAALPPCRRRSAFCLACS